MSVSLFLGCLSSASMHHDWTATKRAVLVNVHFGEPALIEDPLFRSL